jgi:hypothetical protein
MTFEYNPDISFDSENPAMLLCKWREKTKVLKRLTLSHGQTLFRRHALGGLLATRMIAAASIVASVGASVVVSSYYETHVMQNLQQIDTGPLNSFCINAEWRCFATSNDNHDMEKQIFILQALLGFLSAMQTHIHVS